MFDDPLFTFTLIAVFVVLVILLLGLGGFAGGGEFNRKHANRLMRYRIIAQFVAVLLILAVVWWRGSGN